MFHVPWMFEMSVDGCGAIKEGQRPPQLTALHLFLELSIKNGLQIGNWTELTLLHKTLLVSTPPHFVPENSLCAPISLPTVVQWKVSGGVGTASVWGRTETSNGSLYRTNPNVFSPQTLLASFQMASCDIRYWYSLEWPCVTWPWGVLTCEFLDRLQPHADGLVGEQRRGGQRARHALHNANVLHTLGHGERGHSVVRFKGTVAVYAATCRMELRETV